MFAVGITFLKGYFESCSVVVVPPPIATLHKVLMYVTSELKWEGGVTSSDKRKVNKSFCRKTLMKEII